MKIFINHPAGNNGGPAVFVQKLQQGLRKLGYQLEFTNKNVDAALLMISSQGLIPFFKQKGIPVIGRTSGFYIPDYWHNKTPDRLMTADKKSHNQALAKDLVQYDHMVYQSQWSKKMCDQYLTSRQEKFSIIYNGVDLEQFKPIEKISKKLRLIVVGNLRHSYTAEIPLFAYQQLKTDFDIELQFVGKMDDSCKQILNSYTDILIHPAVSQATLPSIYQQADILLHPRQGDTCPNVVSEALACGLPVVTAEWGGASELLGKGGLTVSEAQPWTYSEEYKVNFAQKTREVLENLNFYREEARSQAVKELSLEQMCLNYLKTFVK